MSLLFSTRQYGIITEVQGGHFMIDLSDFKHIHCIGIGGVGLSAIAEILLERGYEVSGSDIRESAITKKLQEMGAHFFIGHAPENITGADLIIYTAAVGNDNPEMAEALKRGVQTASRAQVLGMLMKEYEDSIAISGTHGKTTTTSMLSMILEEGGLDPTILVGGNVPAFHGNCKVGAGSFFVTEACEYMDSFLELHPKVELILNIDADHLDYFKNMENIRKSFHDFTRNLKEGGIIVACSDNDAVREMLEEEPRTLFYGYREKDDFRIGDISFDGAGKPSFTITFPEELPEGTGSVRLHLSVPGEHNILNATAAFAAAKMLGVSPAVMARTLSAFTGTKRRFEVQGRMKNGALVVDDYAHHPTEIAATLAGAKRMEHERIWCIFQPHTYTRTITLFDAFTDAFRDADLLILTDIYAAREKDIYGMDAGKLKEAIAKKHPDKSVWHIKDFQTIVEKVRAEAKPGDIVLTMGAGDVNRIAPLLIGENNE